MEFAYLSNTVTIKTVSEDAKNGTFEIEGLYAGYGLTVGNAIRRALLSSLPGAAVTEIKIKNAPHEFSTLEGVKEDLVELSLNFKRLRFRMHTDEPQVLSIKIKGEQEVTGADIKTTSEVEIVNPEIVLLHVTSKIDFEAEIKVERGLGYSPVESRKTEGRLPIGTIALDAIFTPVTKVNYVIENMRVGERTDYNKLRMDIETDGTISASSALHKSANILKDHFEKISAVPVQQFELDKEAAAPKKKATKAKK